MFDSLNSTRKLLFPLLVALSIIFVTSCAKQPANQAGNDGTASTSSNGIPTGTSVVNPPNTTPTDISAAKSSNAAPTAVITTVSPNATSTLMPEASSSLTPVPTVSSAGSSTGVSFARDIFPILQTTCISCHGVEKTSRRLDMKTYDGLMAGSQNGAVINPGDAAGSLLITAVQAGKMPKNKPHLTPDQIQLLIDWVDAGAKNN